jgi:hypothetical protein
MTNTLDTRTESEKSTDAELATLVRLERRSQEYRRQELAAELAEASAAGDERWVRAARAELGRCDLALLTLAAGRLPA